MTVPAFPLLSLGHRVRIRLGLPLVATILVLITPSTGSAEEPTPITPSYCRLSGCLWENHAEGQTKFKGKKKVKENQLVRIACGWGKRGQDRGIHHIDGRLLLDKEGQPITCYGAGTIFTTAGTHTIGISGKDFTIDFEPVKWYTFDWTHYTWKTADESSPDGDPILEYLHRSEIPTVVFGQGPFGSAKTILLATGVDGEWDWNFGPGSE